MKRALLLDVFGTLVHFGIKRRPFMTLMRNQSRSREQQIQARRRLMASTVPSIQAAATVLNAVWITENQDPEHVYLARLADLRSVLA